MERNSNLAYRTIVLPVDVGGLDEHGMLDAKKTEPVSNIDVAEETAETDRRERWLLIIDGEGERYQRLLTGDTAESPPHGLRERERVTLCEPQEDAESEGESRYLLLMTSPKTSAVESPEKAAFRQTLSEHTHRITAWAQHITHALWPNPSQEQRQIAQAVIKAAEWHDRGKDRLVWQRYACNANKAEPLAKSKKYRPPHVLGGYRHEFGSLLGAAVDCGIANHPERDLILHLIAAHHGWARPHFEPEAFDHENFTTKDNRNAAAEAMRRFGQLQQRFGRWGLAWLESLLRCADALASQESEGQKQ
ncbi:MAG TPA: hypothetical protein EYP04_12945 [Anaerolineae bacterium]|nr:hypothetical protein [Anaerolineae bacterium]